MINMLVVDVIDLLDDSDEDDDLVAVTKTQADDHRVHYYIADDGAELVGANKMYKVSIPLVPLEYMPFWKKIRNGRIPIKYIEYQCGPSPLPHTYHQVLREHHLDLQSEIQPMQKKQLQAKELCLEDFCKKVSVVVKRIPLKTLRRYLNNGGLLRDHERKNSSGAVATDAPHCVPALDNITPAVTVPSQTHPTANINTKTGMGIIQCTRYNNTIADNKKSDFIGSFVHWLDYNNYSTNNVETTNVNKNTTANLAQEQRRVANDGGTDKVDEIILINDDIATTIVESQHVAINDKSITGSKSNADQIIRLQYKTLKKVGKNNTKGRKSNADQIIRLQYKTKQYKNKVEKNAKDAKTKTTRNGLRSQIIQLQEKLLQQPKLRQKPLLPYRDKSSTKKQCKNKTYNQIIKFNEKGNIILVRAKPKKNISNPDISKQVTPPSDTFSNLIYTSRKKMRRGTKLKALRIIQNKNVAGNVSVEEVSVTGELNKNCKRKSLNSSTILNFTPNDNCSSLSERKCYRGAKVADQRSKKQLPGAIHGTSWNHFLNAANVTRERDAMNIQRTGYVPLENASFSGTGQTEHNIANVSQHSLVPQLLLGANRLPNSFEISDQGNCYAFSSDLLNYETRHVDDLLVDVANTKGHLVLLRVGKDRPIWTLASGLMVFSKTLQPTGQDTIYVACGPRTHYIIDFSRRGCSQLKLDTISEYTTVNYNGFTFKVLPDRLDRLDYNHYKGINKDKIDTIDATESINHTLNNIADMSRSSKSGDNNTNTKHVAHSEQGNIRVEYIVDKHNFHNSAISQENNDNKINTFYLDSKSLDTSDCDTAKWGGNSTSHQSAKKSDDHKVHCLAVGTRRLSKNAPDPFDLIDKCENIMDWTCDNNIENCSVASKDCINFNEIDLEKCFLGFNNLDDHIVLSNSDTKQVDQNISDIKNSCDLGTFNDGSYYNKTLADTVNVSEIQQKEQDYFEPLCISDKNDMSTHINGLRSAEFLNKSSACNHDNISKENMPCLLNSVTTSQFCESNRELHSVNDKHADAPVGRIKVKEFAKLCNGSDQRESSNDLIETQGRLYKRLNHEHAIYARVVCAVHLGAVPGGAQRLLGWRPDGLVALHLRG